ncbi:methyltransferase domain-containing protein [Actinoplanes sp. TBRC 11911]|uniref:class I SAM-dependent methyltransferase n=1 Tax=Actinoplanes sp. TBRC 11911 TaxID=2729386 RepID=UPI00145E85E7|nr:methyltransferase domain-containing protein [Actinoplanes sp. TBRC 11911]NMO51463.1 methyltransferase domain-containing protein [Actinoplanes sp. TBRC 11911]
MAQRRHDKNRYTYDNESGSARQQLNLLAEILDGHSLHVLDSLPVRPGWRVLDVGSGSGSVSRLLSERVGPSGSVTAMDVDSRHLDTGRAVEIYRADIRDAALPPAHYDLIHARLVLMHLETRDKVLDRLVEALRPGGALVISDWDCTWQDWLVHGADPDAAAAFLKMQGIMLGLMESNGADLAWARRAPAAMRKAGLTGITTTAWNQLYAGGEAGAMLQHNNTYQLEYSLLGRGLSGAELAAVRTAMTDPETLLYTYLMFSSIGYRP